MNSIKTQQQNDEFCTNIINYLKFNILPEDAKQSSETITWSRFMGIADGLLYHFWTCISDKRKSKCIKQLVIPTSMKQQALKFAHNDEPNCSHQGLSKSLENLRHYFFCKGMYADLLLYIRKCDHCQKMKNPTGHLRVKAPYLARPIPMKPWDVISTDILQLPISSLNKFV